MNMDARELAGLLDSTLLAPASTAGEIENLASEAARRGFASACVPPCHVELASRLLKGSGVAVATVAGFPLGYQSNGVKLIEALKAFGDGASEIDLVMNISHFKSGSRELVSDEIGAIVWALPDAVIKVIIEASLLTDIEKAEACALVSKSGAAFVKTSTGFGPGGATEEDVRLLTREAGGRIGVKAAGGIKDLASALAMIEAGATRVGTSSAVKIMEQFSGGQES